MACLCKQDFLKPMGLKREKFAVDGENYVYVQSLTSKDLLALQKQFGSSETTKNFAFVFELLAKSLVNDAGEFLFENAEQVNEYLHVSVDLLKALAELAIKVSGIDEEKK